jgi:hypothetical protein
MHERQSVIIFLSSSGGSAMLHKEVHLDNIADSDFWLVKTPSASQGSVDDILK